ncbi:MAG: MlaD family protein, partial [Candidatus Eremiobacterota bacterium]
TDAGTRYVVRFDEVSGLQSRAPVHLAGVKVGYVADLQLTKESDVNVTILITRRNVDLFPPPGYVYTITGNLMGDKWVDIQPGVVAPGTSKLQAGDEVQGVNPVTLDDLAREGSAVIAEFRKSVEALNSLVADEKFQSDIKLTMSNFKDISGNLKGASQDARKLVASLNGRVERLGNSLDLVVSHVDETVLAFQDDAEAVGANLRGFSGDLRGLVRENRGNIDTIVLNLRETSITLKKTMASLESLAGNEDLRQDVLATVSNLRKTSEQVQGIASDIRGITSDPKVQKDLRETIDNARQASADARDVLARVKDVSEGSGGKLVQVDIDTEWRTETGQPFTNLNAFVLPDGSYTFKLGVDALGRDNLVNLQAGKNLGADRNYRVRGGVVRSQFGLGADARLFDKRFEVSLDAYNTRDPQVDILGKILFPGDFYILGGVRDVGDRNRIPVVGAGKRF